VISLHHLGPATGFFSTRLMAWMKTATYLDQGRNLWRITFPVATCEVTQQGTLTINATLTHKPLALTLSDSAKPGALTNAQGAARRATLTMFAARSTKRNAQWKTRAQTTQIPHQQRLDATYFAHN